MLPNHTYIRDKSRFSSDEMRRTSKPMSPELVRQQVEALREASILTPAGAGINTKGHLAVALCLFC